MKLKTIIISILLGLYLTHSLGQDYNKLVIENAQWRVIYDNDNTPWPDAMGGWILRGDTTINSIQYKKLFRRGFEEPYSNVVVSQNLYGFLREDTINKIVYALEAGNEGCDISDEEYLLYDFSYQIGEMSRLCFHTEELGDYCELLEIYTSNYFGAERKFFQFCLSSCELIEGIGNFHGLLESPIINISGGWGSYLMDYCVGTDEECNVIYVGADEKSLFREYSISPNPSSGSFFIQSETEELTSIEITVADLSGRKAGFEVTQCEGHMMGLNLSNPGIYLVRLTSSKGCTSFRKVIVIH